MNMLDRYNEHKFLEHQDLNENSFIANVNKSANNIDEIKRFNDYIEEGEVAKLVEAILVGIEETGNKWLVQLQEVALALTAAKSAFNFATLATIPEDIASGAEIELPDLARYTVGTHMLMVSYNGTTCYIGEQYEEIGEIGETSKKIRMLFDLRANDKIMFRVIALNRENVLGELPVRAEGSTEYRTLEKRFGDVVNVRDFGAIGDGITDDTSAIQEAIFYGLDNNKAIVIPEGEYSCSGLNTQRIYAANTDKVLAISGLGRVLLKLTDTFVFTGRIRPAISNMIIKSETDKPAVQLGDVGYYVNTGYFKNVKFHGHPTAMKLVFANAILFDACFFRSNNAYGEGEEKNVVTIGSGTGVNEQVNSINFQSCIFEHAEGNGTFVYASNNTPIYNINFSGCHFETRNRNSRAFNINGGDNINFSNCYFIQNEYQESDTHEYAVNVISKCENISFGNCHFRWNASKIANITGAAVNRLNFKGYVFPSKITSAIPVVSDIFNITDNVTRQTWDIEIVDSSRRICSFPEFANSYYSRLNIYDQITKDGSYLVLTNYNNSFSFRSSANASILAISDSSVIPGSTNTINLGTADRLWKQVFAATGTISTSDSREKQNIDKYPDAILDAWGDVELRQFLFTDAVKRKGKAARIHAGVIAQQVIEVFSKHNLDATKYGLLCYDEWEDEYEDVEVIDKEAEYDSEGNEILPAIKHTEKKLVIPAGNRYGIRYSEALCLEAAYQRRENERLKNELANLQIRLNVLESKLGG